MFLTDLGDTIVIVVDREIALLQTGGDLASKERCDYLFTHLALNTVEIIIDSHAALDPQVSMIVHVGFALRPSSITLLTP